MNVRFLDVSRTDSNRWLKAGVPIACVLCTFTLLFLTACGGGDSGSNTATTSGSASVSTTVPAEEMTPEELGDAIGTTWIEATQELVAVLESKPAAATVKSQVEQLKESYVGELVALGRLREALSDSDRAKVNARTIAVLEASADEPWYTSYMDIYNSYPEDDLEFKNLMASFNILTQYADFDLLKQQAPEEAARLGIE